jgi:hypothetical protein
MKSKNRGATLVGTTRNKAVSHYEKLTRWFIIFMLCPMFAMAQTDHTTRILNQPGTYDQTHLNETVLLDFNQQASSFTTGATVVFRAVEDFTPAAGTDVGLMVTLLDADGQVLDLNPASTANPNSAIYEMTSGQDLIPVAAAYNPNTNEYLVCGNTAATGKPWYIIFDQDLGVISQEQ